MINKKEIKQNYDKLFKLVAKYKEFPFKYNLKIDTHTKIKVHGTIDLTYGDYVAAMIEGDDIKFDIEAPNAVIEEALESECTTLWQFVESFALCNEIHDYFEKHGAEFWKQVKPYLDFFKPVFELHDGRFDKVLFVDDIYDLNEKITLEKLYRLFDPELQKQKKHEEKIYEMIEEPFHKKDFKNMKKILDKHLNVD